MARERGVFRFETHEDGRLVANSGNVEKLRALWLDRTLVSGESLGPGDTGDFDHVAWHIACHLVAASGVLRSSSGRTLWLSTSHDRATDAYAATLTYRKLFWYRTIR